MAAGTRSRPSPRRPASWAAFGIDLSSDGTLAVSTIDRWAPGDDIYLSRDGGAHWSALSTRARHSPKGYPWLVDYLKGEDRMGHWMADLKFNPFKPDEMIYGTGYGLWISRNLASAKADQPVDFDFTVANLEEAATLQMVSPTGGATLLAAFGDVAGAGWDDLARTPPRKSLFTPANETNFSIDYAGANPGHLVRLADRAPTHGYTSVDGGLTWTPFERSAWRQPAAGENWRGPGVAAISAKGTTLVWAPEKDLYVSTDMGRNWKPSTGIVARSDASYLPWPTRPATGCSMSMTRPVPACWRAAMAAPASKPLIEGLPKVESWQQASLAVVPGRLRLVAGHADGAVPLARQQDQGHAGAQGDRSLARQLWRARGQGWLSRGVPVGQGRRPGRLVAIRRCRRQLGADQQPGPAVRHAARHCRRHARSRHAFIWRRMGAA
jgi:hypothetical protein